MSNFLAVLLVLAFGFGQTVKFSLFSPDIRLALIDIWIFVLISFTAIFHARQLRDELMTHKILARAAAAFAGLSLLSLVISGSRYGPAAQFVGSLYWLRWCGYALSAFCLPILYPRQKIWRWLLILGGTVVVTGLYQYAFFPDIRSLEIAEWDPHYFRLVATWLDPGFTGLLLVFTLIFLTVKPPLNRFINLVSWGLTYLAFALTYSRSSYLAFIISMGYISWRRRSLKFLLLVLLLFTLTLALLPRPGGEGVKLERTSSITARLQNWQNSMAIIIHHPVLGVGFNTYRYAQKEFGFLDASKWLTSHAGAGADSSLLFVTATTGLIGLTAYLYYLKSIFNPQPTSAGIAQRDNLQLKSTLVALLVHSLFLNSLFYPAVMLWLALLVAATART